MNLSDLVHRTAGDNKVAATTSNKVNTKLSLLNNGNHNNNLFQQTMIDPATSPSNLFNNFSRQDQQLLFSMPNADWMNSNMFFNNETLMEPITATTNNNNMKPELNMTLSQEQKIFQQATTNTFTNQNIFREFNISLAPQKSPSTATETTSEFNNLVTFNADETKPVEANRSRPILPLTHDVMQKRLKTTIKVTGDNVTPSNIEDGYIQFMLRHDPTYISDGIESLMYAKRKFQSVPKTGDITYTTWDIYQLVLKLHRKEIKNWSQLVGQLGLADMAGRPQFAQRVKRWMHRLKIDSYFDYLLGNAYDFNGPPSTCLNIGNYKKRSKSDNKNEAKYDSQSEEEELMEEEDEHRIPILLAGSRKRMRDASQNSTQMIENAQKFLQIKQNESSEQEVMEEVEEEPQQPQPQPQQEQQRQEEEEEEEEEIEEEEEEPDEEDELASSSSSPTSPTRIIIPSPTLQSMIQSTPPQTTISPPSVPLGSITPVSTAAVTATPSPLPRRSSCSSCSKQTKKATEMEKEIGELKLYIQQLESKFEKQTLTVNKLLRERDRTERWRKQIISDLARGPTIVSDDDEEEEEEEEEEDDDSDDS